MLCLETHRPQSSLELYQEQLLFLPSGLLKENGLATSDPDFFKTNSHMHQRAEVIRGFALKTAEYLVTLLLSLPLYSYKIK